MTEALKALTDAGVSIWLDDLSRERLTSGSLQELITTHRVSGVTTNPTISANAITQSAGAYSAQLHQAAARQLTADEAIRELTTYDVRWACDILRPIHDQTAGRDGWVSIEVDARYAHNTEATIGEATALHWLVDRDNVFIKVPATDEGMPAVTALIADGISVNITLIFSVARYENVMTAWLAGLELARQRGHELSRIHSVASFFISRVDAAANAQLDQANPRKAAGLKNTLGIANAQLAWAAYRRMRASDRWSSLTDAGAIPQRPLWASTGVKDPALPADFYVTGLTGPGVVNTMPEATLHAAAANTRNTPANTLDGSEHQAAEILQRFHSAGIGVNAILARLETDGIDKFTHASGNLRSSINKQLHPDAP